MLSSHLSIGLPGCLFPFIFNFIHHKPLHSLFLSPHYGQTISPGKVRFHLEQIATEFFCHSEFIWGPQNTILKVLRNPSMGKYLICIIQNGHQISIICCKWPIRVIPQPGKVFFWNKKAFGMVQSLIQHEWQISIFSRWPQSMSICCIFAPW